MKALNTYLLYDAVLYKTILKLNQVIYTVLCGQLRGNADVWLIDVLTGL